MFAFVVDAEAQSSDGNTATTGAVDTTGATLLVCAVLSFNDTTTLTDSKSNAWTPLTEQVGTSLHVRLYVCLNPTVGSGHTFQASGMTMLPSVAMHAFSGSAAVVDSQNGTGSGTSATIQPGAVTPVEAGAVFVTAVASLENGIGSITSHAVDAAFVETADLPAAALAVSGAMAYKIQTLASAENPTWTVSGGTDPVGAAAVLACFKVAGTLWLPVLPTIGGRFASVIPSGIEP